MNLIFRKNLKNAVERVLHVPHNYTGGILEMTFVVDHGLSKEIAVPMTKKIAALLRSHSQVFPECQAQPAARKEDGLLTNQVVPISMLQLGRGLADYESLSGKKSLDALTNTLKRFHARSKLVICLLGADAVVLDEERIKRKSAAFSRTKRVSFYIRRKTGRMSALKL